MRKTLVDFATNYTTNPTTSTDPAKLIKELSAYQRIYGGVVVV